MRPGPRRRRALPRPFLVVVRPLFRYSVRRDAFVLRLVGEHRGPVLVLQSARWRDAPGVEGTTPTWLLEPADRV